MAELELGPEDCLYYDYQAPGAGRPTFVFVNALTGSTAMWQGEIAPALQAKGFGVLVYNMRGQEGSRYAPGTTLTPELAGSDLHRLLAAVAPPRPVLVGLSIGGLFAADALRRGSEAAGLVLINTLRKPGLRLDWINEANFRAAATGGLGLLMDLMLPLLVNGEKLAELRPGRLGEAAYAPLPPDDSAYQLMRHAGGADWALPWESLDLPVLILTGLQDRVFYVAEDVAELTARLPNARTIEFADAGHLIPVERPAATAAALIDFGDSLGNA